MTVLVTGAAGRIGTAFAAYAAGRYDLRLADLSGTETLLDVTDLDACRAACEGVDAVVHLAGDASPEADFAQSLLPVNIAGTYNLFRAAADAGVRRVVHASSAQAVEGYPLDVQVREGMPPRPGNLYGVSKAFGEALAAYFAAREGLEAVAVRIGAFERAEDWRRLDARDLSAWAAPDDLCALLVRCLEADLGPSGFAVAHGISDNRFKRLSLEATKARLGYAPEADAFDVWGVGFAEASERRDGPGPSER